LYVTHWSPYSSTLVDHIMQGSVESCCTAIYSFNIDCISSSVVPGSDGQGVVGLVGGNPFYPHPTLDFCLNDGKEDDIFITADLKFVSSSLECILV